MTNQLNIHSDWIREEQHENSPEHAKSRELPNVEFGSSIDYILDTDMGYNWDTIWTPIWDKIGIQFDILPQLWQEPFHRSQLRHRWSPALQLSPSRWKSGNFKRTHLKWMHLPFHEIIFEKSKDVQKQEKENLALCVSCCLVARPREQNHHIFNSRGDLVIKNFHKGLM